MASIVTVHIVNIWVNTVNLGFASGNSIFLMLTICTVTLEAMQYLYNSRNCFSQVVYYVSPIHGGDILFLPVPSLRPSVCHTCFCIVFARSVPPSFRLSHLFPLNN